MNKPDIDINKQQHNSEINQPESIFDDGSNDLPITDSATASDAVVTPEAPKEEHVTTDKKKKSKLGAIIVDVVIALILALALYIAVGSAVARKAGKPFFFFGLSAQLVVTDSMTPTINKDELVFVRQADISEVTAMAGSGDIVMFKSLAGNLKGQNILHRAVNSGVDTSGKLYLETQGDKHGSPLDQLNGQPNITADNFVGIYQGKSAFLGKTVLFFKKGINWLFIGLLIIAVIIATIAIKKLCALKKAESKKSKNE